MLNLLGFEVIASLLSGRVLSGINWDFVDIYMAGLSLLALLPAWYWHYRYKKTLNVISNKFGAEVADEVKWEITVKSVWCFIIFSALLGLAFVLTFASYFPLWTNLAFCLCILCSSTYVVSLWSHIDVERKKLHLELGNSKK